MATRVDVARTLFPQLKQHGTDGDDVQVYWGTITEDLGEGWYRVELDGGIEVEAFSDSPHNVGDRVQVVRQGNKFVIVGNAGLIKQVNDEFGRTFEAIQDTHEELAKQITEQVDEAFGEANAALEEFKSTHTLTDDDITKSITDTKSEITETFEGKLSDLGETYTTKTEFSRGIDGVKSEVAETYSTKSETNSLETSLKSEIKQSASSITSTVEQSVDNKLGNYYSKTEWTQGATGYTATVHQAVETTNNNEQFLDTYFTANSSGITVGSSAHTYKSRMGTQGFSILQGTSELARIIANGNYTQISSQASKALQLYSAGEINLFGGFLTILQNSQYSSFTATATDNTGYLLGASRLYWNESGTNAAFTLSRSVSYYSFLEIHYTDGTRRLTKRCTLYGSTCSVMLDRTIMDTSSMELWINASVLNINGRSASFSNQAQSHASNGGSVYTQADSQIKVLSVTGWR